MSQFDDDFRNTNDAQSCTFCTISIRFLKIFLFTGSLELPDQKEPFFNRIEVGSSKISICGPFNNFHNPIDVERKLRSINRKVRIQITNLKISHVCTQPRSHLLINLSHIMLENVLIGHILNILLTEGSRQMQTDPTNACHDVGVFLLILSKYSVLVFLLQIPTIDIGVEGSLQNRVDYSDNGIQWTEN